MNKQELKDIIRNKELGVERLVETKQTLVLKSNTVSITIVKEKNESKSKIDINFEKVYLGRIYSMNGHFSYLPDLILVLKALEKELDE